MPIVQTAVPRLCLIALRFTRPYLVSSVITLLTEPDDNTEAKAVCLVIVAGIVYISQAVATLRFELMMGRCITMARGAIVALIYDTSLRIEDGVYDHAAAVTLMGTDTVRITASFSQAFYIVFGSIEVALGIFLLARQLGWVCIMPVVVVMEWSCPNYT